MPIDRQAKQKKKREEKRKAFRRGIDRLQLQEKLDEYEWMPTKLMKKRMHFRIILGCQSCAKK